jgi:hypothetical protein
LTRNRAIASHDSFFLFLYKRRQIVVERLPVWTNKGLLTHSAKRLLVGLIQAGDAVVLAMQTSPPVHHVVNPKKQRMPHHTSRSYCGADVFMYDVCIRSAFWSCRFNRIANIGVFERRVYIANRLVLLTSGCLDFQPKMLQLMLCVWLSFTLFISCEMLQTFEINIQCTIVIDILYDTNSL